MTITETKPANPTGDGEDPATFTTMQDYLDRETRRVPAGLRERGDAPPDDYYSISPSVFISPEYARAEFEHMWLKTWQMACREREIPNAGDFIEYSLGDQSIIIVRTSSGAIRALRNACSHRGTELARGLGNAEEFVCSFHGWVYSLEGDLTTIPCKWDFPKVDQASSGLTVIRTGTWNGFVFVNFDPDCEPLEEYLGPTVVEHFREWPMAPKVKVAHVAQVVPCNWKVALEAFIEIYHPFSVHPQVVAFAGDINAQYDAWGRHARMYGPMGVPNPLLLDPPDEQGVVEAMITSIVAHIERKAGDVVEIPEVKEGQTAREVLAEWSRESRGKQNKRDYSETSDSEMLDVIEYFVFPNLVPWGGHSFPMIYRVRPDGLDPESCIWEVMLLMDEAADAAPDHESPVRWLEPGEPWANAHELGGLGPIIDQDIANLSKMQRGMHSAGLTEINLAESMEVNIRRLHRHVDQYINAAAQRSLGG